MNHSSPLGAKQRRFVCRFDLLPGLKCKLITCFRLIVSMISYIRVKKPKLPGYYLRKISYYPESSWNYRLSLTVTTNRHSSYAGSFCKENNPNILLIDSVTQRLLERFLILLSKLGPVKIMACFFTLVIFDASFRHARLSLKKEIRRSKL